MSAASERVPTLPSIWTVELIGLVSTVKFSGPNGLTLQWSDGDWYFGSGQLMRTTHAIEHCTTMAQARKVGSEFINRSF